MFEPSIWSQPEGRKLAPHAFHVPSFVSICYTHRQGFILCRRKLANLGLKEALAPQGEGFRFGRTEAARDVARRRAPVDGTYLLLQGVDQPFAVVVHVELVLPRAGLLHRGGEGRRVQRRLEGRGAGVESGRECKNRGTQEHEKK